jgi:hypothetical protein
MRRRGSADRPHLQPLGSLANEIHDATDEADSLGVSVSKSKTST